MRPNRLALHVTVTAAVELRHAMRTMRGLLYASGFAVYRATIEGVEYYPVLSPGHRAQAEEMGWDLVCSQEGMK